MKNIEYGTEFLDQLKDKVHEQQWEIDRLKQQIEDIKLFCKSFDLNKISDKEKVMLDSIMLIANGTIKVVK